MDFGVEEPTNPYGYCILLSHRPLYVPTDPEPKLDCIGIPIRVIIDDKKFGSAIHVMLFGDCSDK